MADSNKNCYLVHLTTISGDTEFGSKHVIQENSFDSAMQEIIAIERECLGDDVIILADARFIPYSDFEVLSRYL